MELTFRFAGPGDLAAVNALEAACFPVAEACTPEQFAQRLRVFPECFLLAEQVGVLAGMVNGGARDDPHLDDALYADAALHRPSGAWQMIYGLDTAPAFRRQGVAASLLERFITLARERGRRGVVLTCKDRLVPYYAKFGFRLLGVSDSTHGGVAWNEMRLTF